MQFVGMSVCHRHVAVPSKFPIPSKKVSKARRQLHRVQASEEPSSCEDSELNESDRLSVNKEIENVQEANAQLEAQLKVAND